MKIVLRVLSVLIGLMLLMNGLRFIVDPAGASAGLEMDLLTGVGASSQLGDIGAFFIGASILLGLGQRAGQSHWLYAAALMLGSAATMRTLVWVAGSADFAPQFIVPELVMTAVLVAAARVRAGEGGSETSPLAT